jgi:hypothetical protein
LRRCNGITPRPDFPDPTAVAPRGGIHQLAPDCFPVA